MAVAWFFVGVEWEWARVVAWVVGVPGLVLDYVVGYQYAGDAVAAIRRSSNAGDPAANFLQPSPLSAFPVSSDIPGLVGFFQVDARGDFSTPLVPSAPSLAGSYGISEPELALRRSLQDRIREILSKNRLVEAPRVGERTAEPAKSGTAESKRAPTRQPGRSSSISCRTARSNRPTWIKAGVFTRNFSASRSFAPARSRC